MNRRWIAATIACAVGLTVVPGCGSLPTATREHLPVVGLTTASVYVEYGGDWAEDRWQSPITQTIWKLVEPVSQSQEDVAHAKQQAFQASFQTTSRDFANEGNAGAISGASAAARPRAGYALADRTNTFQGARAASSATSSTIYQHTAVDWVARHLKSTHGYAQTQHTLALGGTSESESQRPQLAITAKATPDYIIAGDRTEMVITVHNPSPRAAIDPVVHLELPAGSDIRGVEGARRVRENRDGAEIRLKDIPSGDRATVTLRLRIDSEPLQVASVR